MRFRHEFHWAPYEVFSHVSHPFFHGSPNVRVNTSLELARDVMTPAILRCWLRKMPDRYHEIDPGLSDHSSRSMRQAPFANNLKLGHWRTYTACRPQHHQHTNSVDARIPLSQLLQEFCPQRLGSPHCRELLSCHRTTIAVPLTFPSHGTRPLRSLASSGDHLQHSAPRRLCVEPPPAPCIHYIFYITHYILEYTSYTL